MNRTLPLFFTLIAVISFACCTPKAPGTVYVKNGKQYGKVTGSFRHRWWNYYERGVSYSDGEFYAAAISDFQEAIHQREEDQRRARTYGMHFVDYFPHRELGIVHYFTGNLDVARQELERSMDQFPSAKARFYLDRVRKKLIEKQQTSIPAPILRLDLEAERIWTRSDPVVISGIAEDSNYINRLLVNNNPVYIPEASKRLSFTQNLELSQGRHAVDIVVENLPGKITRKSLTIHVDREGPMIAIDRMELKDGAGGKEILIGGAVFDEAGVSEISVAGRTLAISNGTEVFFSEKIAVKTDRLEVTAADALGNQTVARISLSHLAEGGGLRTTLACADCDGTAYRFAGIFGPSDTQPPEILLKGWTDHQTVFQEQIFIEGQVRDQNKIVDLFLDKKQILRRRGNLIFFNALIELSEGENTLVVNASDENGNTAEKVITVFRRIPAALQLKERMSMTVLPFDQKGALSEISDAFQDYLINALVNQNRFNIVERSKLEAVLEEQKLSRTRLFDEKTAIELGKLIASRAITAGTMVASRAGMEIIARVIDTETSAILASVDVYDEITEFEALQSLSQGLAVKFQREFPLLQGLVIEKKADGIMTDLGADSIKVQRGIIIFRDVPVRHPVTGKALGADNEVLGRGRIIQVTPQVSKAVLLKGHNPSISPLDKIITE